MQNRIAYDNVFLPIGNNVNYKGENITDISIFFVYKVINTKTGKEIFPQDKQIEYKKDNFCYANQYWRCVVDSNNGYKMIPNEKITQDSKYNVTYEIGKCQKYVDDTPIEIQYDEFSDILLNNFNVFDNSNNKPAQSCAYYLEKL